MLAAELMSDERHADWQDIGTDFLLPVQYRDLVNGRNVLEGERKLLFAVLEDAIRCYVNNMSCQSPRRRALFCEVNEWIEASGGQNLFAFENLCDALGIDGAAVRERLRALRLRSASRGYKH